MQFSLDDRSWRSAEVEAGAPEEVERALDSGHLAPEEQARFHKSVRALVAENARLRAVLGHCPKGIAVLDEDGRVTGFNREFCALLGGTPQLGARITQHFGPTDRELLHTVVARAGTTRRAAAVVRVETAANDPREVEFLAATLPSSGDRSIGVVLAGTDRTVDLEDEHARLTLEDANHRDTLAFATTKLAREVERHRVAALTALREITAGADGDRARLEQAIAALEAQGGVLAIPPRARPDGECDVAAAARRAIRIAWVGRARRLVTVDAQIDEGLRARIAESDLVQVLSNVLGHAVRALEKQERFGWITVTADRARDAIELAIRDNGAGTPPRVLQRSLVLGETPDDDDDEALALSIARSILDARGGTVRALSEPDRGTTILITLPVA